MQSISLKEIIGKKNSTAYILYGYQDVQTVVQINKLARYLKQQQ